MVEFKVVLKSVTIDHGALFEETRPMLHRVHSGLTRRTADRARVIAPVGRPRPDRAHPPGRLKASIREDQRFLHITGLDVSFKGGVTAHAEYAAPVHEGAHAHPIYPRFARALSFYWEKVGHHVVFMKVNHPGNKPNPFMVRAVREAMASDPYIHDIRREGPPSSPGLGYTRL